MSAANTGKKRQLEQRTANSNIPVPEKKYPCPNCPYRADRPSVIKNHAFIHTGEKPFKCSLCPFKTASKTTHQLHCRRHTGEKPFKCSECDDREYSDKRGLKAHFLSRHSEARPYTCTKDGCDSRFKLRSALAKHVNKVHKKGSLAEKWPCALCPKIFLADSSLQSHLRTHTGERPFKCSECDFSTTRKPGLKLHIRTRHSGTGDKLPFRFHCDFPGCRSKYKSRYPLKAHIEKVHKGITRFRCPECPKQFFTRYLLKIHNRRAHTKEKPYECDLCEFKGPTGDAITQHKKNTHSEYLNLECPDCGKKFKHANSARRHWNQVHAINKPQVSQLLPCPEPDCGKEYGSISGLKSHVYRCHTKDPKRFTCHFCPYASPQYIHLVSHLKVHTGEAPYKCEGCGKCFKQKDKLETHKQHIHSEERPFKCGLCAYRGKTKNCLKRHEKTHSTAEWVSSSSVQRVTRSLTDQEQSCERSKRREQSSGGLTEKDCKPCFVRVVRLKVQ